MTVLLEWLICYATPVLTGVSIAYGQRFKETRMATIHAGILISAALVTLLGMRLEWNISLTYILSLLIVSGLSAYAVERFGILYVLSCALQEYCILLAAVLLAPLGVSVLSAAATATVFALAHRMNFKNWPLRFLIIGGWGFCSILLYDFLHEPLLNISLHILGGTILIYTGVLFPTRLIKEA